jgi:DNA-binding NtrC family response regulator
MDRLTTYSWPGNVRELENVIERAAILAHGPVIQIDDALLQVNTEAPAPSAGTLQDVERRHILLILGETEWVIEGNNGAAVRLGIHPNTLRSRMQKLGIKKPKPAS